MTSSAVSLSALLGITLLATVPASAGQLHAARGASVPGQYIVELAPGAQWNALGANRAQMAGDVAGAHGAQVKHLFHRVLDGFSVQVSAAEAAVLADDPRVKAVYPVVPMYLRATQTGAPWHLDRSDQRDLPLNTTYNFDFDGAGIHMFVIDTGLRATHQQFAGRVSSGFDAVGDGQGTNDCQGHGTWTSGLAAATTYGAARRATVHPVRVFGCEGSTTSDRVLAGLDWAVNTGLRPAVVNMSLGGGPDPATDTAIQNATAAGVVVVVAAGNASADACGGSPSRAPAAITVGSSERNDSRSGFSNFGPCVDLFAPGGGVTATSFTGDNATTTASGTSGSSPVVAGIAALYLQQFPGASPAQVQQAIKDAATTGRLTNIGAGSPNRLAFSLFGGTPSTPTPTPTVTRTPTPTPIVTATPTPTPTPTGPPSANLALNKPATGSASCNANEGPAKAVNGSVSGGNADKWCSLVDGTKFLQVDLGGTFNVGRFVVKHAEAGGESATFNTRDFNIATSADGVTFTSAVTVSANRAGTTTHVVAGRAARFVRLNVTAPEQPGGGSAARIYELEVYAAAAPASNLALNKPATGSTPCNVNEGPAKAVNGSVSGGNSDKWCSHAVPRLLQVDLGGSFSVARFVVRHAAAGGESATLNTRDFNLQVSMDGTAWTTVAAVAGNTEAVTTHVISPASARHVRLEVITPTQTTNTGARIYELEAYTAGF
jgi:subtilisin family serine protease